MDAEGIESPLALRERAAEEVRALVGADDVFFFTYALVDGINHYTSLCGALSDEFRDQLLPYESHPSVSGPFWNPALVPLDERNRFQNDASGLEAMARAGSKLYTALYEPLEITRQCRTRLYDGRRFLGYISCVRRGQGAAQFTPDELARLDGVAQRLKSHLLSAERLEEELPSPAYVLFDRDRKRLDFATPGVRRWFTDERVACLRHILRAQTPPEFVVLDNQVLRFCELVGEEGRRVMVSVERSGSPCIDPRVALTPTQREVADFAIHGATNREIARHLGVSPETIKTHIKNIYERLGVASRLELSQALQG